MQTCGMPSRPSRPDTGPGSSQGAHLENSNSPILVPQQNMNEGFKLWNVEHQMNQTMVKQIQFIWSSSDAFQNFIGVKGLEWQLKKWSADYRLCTYGWSLSNTWSPTWKTLSIHFLLASNFILFRAVLKCSFKSTSWSSMSFSICWAGEDVVSIFGNITPISR